MVLGGWEGPLHPKGDGGGGAGFIHTTGAVSAEGNAPSDLSHSLVGYEELSLETGYVHPVEFYATLKISEPDLHTSTHMHLANMLKEKKVNCRRIHTRMPLTYTVSKHRKQPCKYFKKTCICG